MKTYYADYAAHAIRYYSRHSAPTFRTRAERQNWTACDDAMKSFSVEERSILVAVFCGTIPHSIAASAQEFDLAEDAVWALVRSFNKRFARRRGLL